VVHVASHGTITSVPSGIDCGTSCSALFFDAVALTATVADPPHAFFGGWSDPCGMDPTCALPDGDSVTLDARFEVISPTVTVTIAGPGRGYVLVSAGGLVTTCTHSCTRPLYPLDAVALYAFTPSTFTGWTGACTGSTRACDLGSIDDDLAVTATFDRDEHEVATVLPRAPAIGLALAPDGDVVVADADGVTRLHPDGTVAWTTPIAGGASDLATDTAGDVFGRSGSGLFALSAAGAPTWTRTFAAVGVAHLSMESSVAASPDGTVIAVLTSDGAHVVDDHGDDRFVATGLSAEGVAVAPDGTVGIAIPSTAYPEQVEVVRYSAAGAALVALDPLPGDYDVSIEYDSASDLCAAVTGFGGALVSRFAPDLGNVFTSGERTGAAFNVAAAIGSDGADDVIYLREGGLGGRRGYQLEVFSPTGAITWTHTRPGTDADYEGVTVSCRGSRSSRCPERAAAAPGGGELLARAGASPAGRGRARRARCRRRARWPALALAALAPRLPQEHCRRTSNRAFRCSIRVADD
jgi:hypothetical protein